MKAFKVETLCPRCRKSFYFDADIGEIWVVHELLKECNDHRNQEKHTAVSAYITVNSSYVKLSLSSSAGLQNR